MAFVLFLLLFMLYFLCFSIISRSKQFCHVVRKNNQHLVRAKVDREREKRKKKHAKYSLKKRKINVCFSTINIVMMTTVGAIHFYITSSFFFIFFPIVIHIPFIHSYKTTFLLFFIAIIFLLECH